LQTKSFEYAEGRLVRCPPCRGGDVPAGEEGVATEGGGVLTGGLLGSTCGVSRPPLAVISSPSLLPSDRVPKGDGSGVFTGALLGSTGGASCLLWVVSFSLSPNETPSAGGGFAFPSPYLDSEVLVAGLALEVEGLALEAVGALPLMEAAFLVLAKFLSAARPLHILVHVAAARTLLSVSWALTTGGGRPLQSRLG